MFRIVSGAVFAVLAVSFFYASSPAVAADCTERTKTSCERSTTCTWVKGYETSTGVRVSSYCRSKPTSSARRSPLKSRSNRRPPDCKDIIRTICLARKGCTWRKGYTTSSGTKVKGHCRVES